mgnify:CR=1 FL=1
MNLTPDSTVLIATFSPWKNGIRLPINGNVEPMIDFFTPRVRKTVLIDQVYPGSDTVLPRIEVYEKKKRIKILSSSWVVRILEPFLKTVNKDGTHIVFKIRDFLSVLDWSFRSNESYDFYIGFESVNALAGVLLKKFGKVSTVIYYVSDYSPNRYQNKVFNWFYLRLDRMAARYADVIWDVSPAMQPARMSVGLDPAKSAPVLVVPNALYPKQIRSESIERIFHHTIVFMGTLGEENGPDIAIKAMTSVIKTFPDAVLNIVGGGNTDMKRLKDLVSNLKLKKFVVFHGFISDRLKISSLIRRFQIAVAPYKRIAGSARLYGDATKIRAYLAAGLPTITTDVPPLGKTVESAGAAIIVSDTPEGLVRGVEQLFKNETFFIKMKAQAIKFAKDNTWDKEYTQAFKVMSKLKNS